MSAHLRYRIVENPQEDPALQKFSAGGIKRSDGETNALVKRLVSGRASQDFTILVVEDEEGQIAGVAGYRERPLAFHDEVHDAIYLAVVAVDKHYRDQRLPSGETVGSSLVAGALDQIARQAGGAVPAVWGLVQKNNHASRKLLSRHGFAPLPADEDYEIEYRPAGLPVSPPPTRRHTTLSDRENLPDS